MKRVSCSTLVVLLALTCLVEAQTRTYEIDGYRAYNPYLNQSHYKMTVRDTTDRWKIGIAENERQFLETPVRSKTLISDAIRQWDESNLTNAKTAYYNAQASAIRYQTDGWAEHDAKIRRRHQLRAEYRQRQREAPEVREASNEHNTYKARAARARLIAGATKAYTPVKPKPTSFRECIDYDSNGKLRVYSKKQARPSKQSPNRKMTYAEMVKDHFERKKSSK